MRRLFWITVGFFAGIVASVISALLVNFWLWSPLRAIEKLTGLDLPSEVSLEWYDDEHEMFFGQGSTLKAFKIPTDFSEKTLTNCPPGFRSGRFAQSGIPESKARVDEHAPACFFSKETASREDVVVILQDKMFYLRIDR